MGAKTHLDAQFPIEVANEAQRTTTGSGVTMAMNIPPSFGEARNARVSEVRGWTSTQVGLVVAATFRS